MTAQYVATRKPFEEWKPGDLLRITFVDSDDIYAGYFVDEIVVYVDGIIGNSIPLIRKFGHDSNYMMIESQLEHVILAPDEKTTRDPIAESEARILARIEEMHAEQMRVLNKLGKILAKL